RARHAPPPKKPALAARRHWGGQSRQPPEGGPVPCRLAPRVRERHPPGRVGGAGASGRPTPVSEPLVCRLPVVGDHMDVGKRLLLPAMWLRRPPSQDPPVRGAALSLLARPV